MKAKPRSNISVRLCMYDIAMKQQEKWKRQKYLKRKETEAKARARKKAHFIKLMSNLGGHHENRI